MNFNITRYIQNILELGCGTCVIIGKKTYKGEVSVAKDIVKKKNLTEVSKLKTRNHGW